MERSIDRIVADKIVRIKEAENVYHVGHVREVSMTGERMPAKSTYFYPKLLTGLVINPLE